MPRMPRRCPCCSQPLGICRDMWGPYYMCQGCGFTAEDDDELRPHQQIPAFLTAYADPHRDWQATYGRFR